MCNLHGARVARTRNSLSAAHSLSVNFCVSGFCGSSSLSGAGVVSATCFCSGSELMASTVDMMVSEEKNEARS